MIIRKRPVPPNDRLQPQKGHEKYIFETLHNEIKCVLSTSKKNLLTDTPKNIVLNIRNPHADVLLLPLRGNWPLDAAVPLVEEISHHPSGRIHWLSFGIFTFYSCQGNTRFFPS